MKKQRILSGAGWLLMAASGALAAMLRTPGLNGLDVPTALVLIMFAGGAVLAYLYRKKI